jgi:acetyl esterase/lipase
MTLQPTPDVSYYCISTTGFRFHMKLLTAGIFSLLLMNQLKSQEILPLYKGEIPGNKKVADKESSVTEDGILRISNISVPTLQVFLPDPAKATGAAIVICPGGGYWINAYGHEGVDVAKRLNEAGIAAFVLKYRIPDDAVNLNKATAPLQDAQQAIKLVRDNATKWKIDGKRVGILGFSAGGHLASTAGTHFEKSYIENASNTSLRPDFLVLVYPVISFDKSIGHLGSRDKLLGNNPDDSLVKLFSNELQVTDKTPPTFLVHATDDGGVSVLNSVRFYEALLQHKVPAEMHIYQNGGHGFGLNNKTTTDSWIERCLNWLQASGWLNK